jgi:MFS family permease
LILLLSVFAVLATTYAVVVPLFEGPDEDDHFRYAKYLADHRALPVQLFQQGGGEAGHQGWQPPLYYGLAALVISPIDTSDYERRLQRNPAQSFTGDRACCGRNLYFHLDAENFPYERTTLAVHLARGVTILFGMLTVCAIYLLVLAVFPGQRDLALATTAVATLNPSFLFASALVSNDVPLVAFCTLALWVMAKMVTRAWNADWKSGALLGTFVALAILTKTTALGLLPFVAISLAFVAYRARSWRTFFIVSFATIIPLVILNAWYFARNQLLYGDALAYRLIAVSALPPRDAPLTMAELLQINLPWLWQTFWGGPTPGDFPQWFLNALLVAFVIGCVGAAIYIARQWRALGIARLFMLGIVFAWLALIFVAQLQFIRTASGTDQGRYLFPAIASIAMIYVLGWCESVWQIVSRVRRAADERAVTRNVSLAWTGFAVALPVFVLFTFTLPAYARPALTDADAIQKNAAPIQTDFENGMQLRGYQLGARTLACGDILDVHLFWTSDQRIRETYRVFAHLVNAQGAVAGNKDVIPGGGAYPTVYWKPGELFRDTIRVPLNSGARAGNYNVIVGAYKFGEPDERVNLRDSDADFVALGDVQVNAPPEGCP